MYNELISLLRSKYELVPAGITEQHDEVYLDCAAGNFAGICLALHKELPSPVMSMFAVEMENAFRVHCAFFGKNYKKWFFVTMDVQKSDPKFTSIAKEIYSANLFEREMKEMFGINITGNPDTRSLRLHDEVWPRGSYPLRKDFVPSQDKPSGKYKFIRVEGNGIFEIPVGPVHAGVIGPGHFRFSVAGEPIINMEARLGFTHRGVEKLMEGKLVMDGLKLSECVAGDSSVAHGLAFVSAIEKISRHEVHDDALRVRAALLELERMYAHAGSIGGIALDVGFSQSAALASIIKESLHQVNEKLTGSRFLKGAIVPGGINMNVGPFETEFALEAISGINKDLHELKRSLFSSVSFLDRVDTTGVLHRKTAEDLGVFGVAGRASGVDVDLRRDMPAIYRSLGLNVAGSQAGDVLARLNVRFDEFENSSKMVAEILAGKVTANASAGQMNIADGFALGHSEGWRGPVLYWVAMKDGKIDRCKIVDPSFHNWQGLSYAVLENIVPDFPVCNKSFDLSYGGNDL